MARLVRGTSVEMPGLEQLQRDLADFPKAVRRKYMKAAFNAAAKIGAQALKKTTPRGPTGNLRRAVAVKASAGYGLAGYRQGGKRAKPDDDTAKGYHQGFLEFGTKTRRTKGRFASTFNSKSKGRGGAMQIATPARGRLKGVLVTRKPSYPRSFFKSAAAGQQVDLGAMPVGGRTGKPPVATAFAQSKGQIGSVLQQQASTALDRAAKDIARRHPPVST